MRHAKVSIHPLFRVARFLVAHNDDFLAVKASHPANNRRIVAEAAIPVNLAPIGKNALDIIQRVGTLRMARQFRALPRVQVRRNFAAKVVHPFVQLLDLAKRFRVLPLQRLQSRDLPSIFSSSCCAFSPESILMTFPFFRV